MTSTRSLGLLLTLLSCSRTPPRERPDTALGMCEQLATALAPDTLECSPVSDPAVLTAFQAVELAVLQRRAPAPKGRRNGALKDIGWVSYRAGAQGPLHEVVFEAARQAIALGPVLEASNDAALVDVLVYRGEVTAAGYERLKADVASLQGLASR